MTRTPVIALRGRRGSENRVAVSGVYLLVFGGLLIAYDMYAEGRVLKANAVPAILVASTSLAASVLWYSDRSRSWR
jgi:hypothetical protein